MTHTTSEPICLHDPGELLASIPSLLGFYPRDSLVLVHLRRCTSRCQPRQVLLTARCDLVAVGASELQWQSLVEQLLQPADRGAAACAVVLVGPPPTALVEARMEELAAAARRRGVEMLHTWTCPELRSGARWQCLQGCGCAGSMPDPRSQAIAAASVADGLVTFDSRETMQQLLAPAPEQTLRARAELLCAQEPADPDAAPLALAALHRMVGRAQDPGLSEQDLLRAARALEDLRVRDAVMSYATGELAERAEVLWRVLTQQLPAPHVAEPAVLLAVSAYLRGDGALAQCALDRAEQARPAHRLTELLRLAIATALPPNRLRSMIEDVVADADIALAEPDSW